MSNTKPKKMREKFECPKNPSHKVHSRGTQIHCMDCNRFYEKNPIVEGIQEDDFSLKMETNGNEAIVTAGTDKDVKTLADLIEVCEIDTKMWHIERHLIGKSSGYRKDRKSRYLQENGKIKYSEVADSGKILRAPMYSVKVWLSRKTAEIRDLSAIHDQIADLKKKSPKVPKFKYPKHKEGCMYELDIFDLHLGKLTWAEESGHDYDIHIARDCATKAVKNLLEYADVMSRMHPVSQILIPWGNDFFNVDNMENTTTGGTPQQEDTRWRKTFRFGRMLTQEIILLCREVAPVKVIFIAGNHDTTRLFHLGEAIDARFYNDPNVIIDNTPRSRKYHAFGNVLLGFAHGKDEKLENLPTVMSMDQKQEWAKAEYREWHLGDKHTRKQYEIKHEEQLANTIRFLSSLSGTDLWHFDKQFVGNVRAATSFLWHPKRGLVGQFNALGE